jgi:NAD(P)-dependent dehydrogenase (short-subunit alcohol dehydrogenase family)
MDEASQAASGKVSARRGHLTGLVAIVTGASAGIGAEIARELARQGATVVLAARREDELEVQARAISDAGGKALAVPTDVADEAQIARLVERTEESFGHVDVLVSNAGIGERGAFLKAGSEDIRRLVDVNLLATMLLARALLPGMLERGRGAIIAVASVAGHVAISPLYSGTKFGLRGFCLSLRRQLLGTGVSVSVVSPGYIRTPLTRRRVLPMPGPEVVAKTVARLIRHPRREAIVPRYYCVLVWLEHLLPWLADALLRPRRRKAPSRAAQG